MRIGSLFSGIGGLELGLEMSGLGHAVWQVEQSEFCRKVLAKHWPNVERFEDVREVGSAELARVDLLCGGFPCQDISSAGKGAGLDGNRSGLWFEYARIVEELQPEWVVVENVASGAKRWVDQVSFHLEQLGYETLPVPLSAEAVGAPHRRARIFLVAYSLRKQLRQQSRGSSRANGEGEAFAPKHGEEGAARHTDTQGEPTLPVDVEMAGVQGYPGHGGWAGGPPVSPVCGVDDGLSARSHRGVVNVESGSPESSATSTSYGEALRTVRNAPGEAGETSPRLFKADRDRSSVYEVPPQSRPGMRIPTSKTREALCDLWQFLPSEAQQKIGNVQREMLEQAWSTECGKAMAQSLSGEGLRTVWMRIYRRACSGANVQQVMWEQARMVKAQRTERLRALGNAVVPQCAEVVGWMIREMMENQT